ncbi:hypothetical protein EDC04DRAFT_1257886 [Pisolithus marmoratus]|nr:hypothetical protein EDC04DRAFT_1257886 [Pisolithus marmoratus]
MSPASQLNKSIYCSSVLLRFCVPVVCCNAAALTNMSSGLLVFASWPFMTGLLCTSTDLGLTLTSGYAYVG